MQIIDGDGRLTEVPAGEVYTDDARYGPWTLALGTEHNNYRLWFDDEGRLVAAVKVAAVIFRVTVYEARGDFYAPVAVGFIASNTNDWGQYDLIQVAAIAVTMYTFGQSVLALQANIGAASARQLLQGALRVYTNTSRLVNMVSAG